MCPDEFIAGRQDFWNQSLPAHYYMLDLGNNQFKNRQQLSQAIEKQHWPVEKSKTLIEPLGHFHIVDCSVSVETKDIPVIHTTIWWNW